MNSGSFPFTAGFGRRRLQAVARVPCSASAPHCNAFQSGVWQRERLPEPSPRQAGTNGLIWDIRLFQGTDALETFSWGIAAELAVAYISQTL